MNRIGTLAILLALVLADSFLAMGKKPKAKKLLPPAESHGAAISGCGCDRQYVQDMPSDAKRTAVFNLIVWAEYGKEHKKYWKKTYGTYQVPMKGEVQSSGESAGPSGRAIGPMSWEHFDFSAMNKACADWGRDMQSTFKIRPNVLRVAQ
jgi:hypothetical protein